MSENRIVTPNKNSLWFRLTALIFLFLCITAVLYKTGFFSFFFHEDRILAFLDSLGPLSFIGFIAIQAAQVVFAPIPGELTGLVGGYVYGPFLGVLLSTMGLIIGSFMAFALSRALGRPFVERFVHQSIMDRFDYLLHHKGLFVVFLCFLMPGFPKDYLCFVLGLGHLSTVEFLAVSSVGRLFGTTLLTLSGGYIRDHEYEKLLLLIVLATLCMGTALFFRKKLECLFRSLHARSCGTTMNDPCKSVETPEEGNS